MSLPGLPKLLSGGMIIHMPIIHQAFSLLAGIARANQEHPLLLVHATPVQFDRGSLYACGGVVRFQEFTKNSELGSVLCRWD